MRKIAFLSLAIMFLIQGTEVTKAANSIGRQKNDTSSTITLTGKLVDAATKAPVVFASVFQTGSSTGTVSNADGEFILKVPKNTLEGTVSITYLGYKNKTVSIKELLDQQVTIAMESFSIPIDAVVIKKIDPLNLIKEAMSKIKENYKQGAEMQTGFYRETIKQNRSYVSISEAVLDIYNSGYRDAFDYDRVKIFKGRKSKDVKKMDTVLVKFQGGPRTALYLDVVKNPAPILDAETFEFYEYTLGGIVSIDNRNNYVINFKQSRPSIDPLYEGKIYIDVESTSITSIDFQIAEQSLDEATSVLVKKKPATMKMDVLSGHYLVKYRMIDGVWVLNYVRSEVVFKSKWDKKFFRSNIATTFEMAITDRNTENVEKFNNKDAVKFSDVLSEQVSSFEDPDFWGDYNLIKPDESIQVAIEKLNKKLKR